MWPSFRRRSLHAVLITSCLLASWVRSEAGISLPGPAVPGVDPGELLVGELNCLACHEAPESVRQRVASRGAPKLGGDGLRLTAQWLRAWLADPAASKPGTAMPHALAGLGGAQKAEAVEALAQYLVSVQPQGAPVGVSADASRAEKGRLLYHTIGCVACHEPFDRGDATAETWDRARANAVPLGDLARKYPAGELARFLRDPVAHRPGGRMPSLGLTESESLDLATYLLREQLTAAAQARVEPVAGLKWEYFEGNFHRCADLANQTPVATGVTDSINARPAKRENNFGLRFSGLIEVPAEGEYEFWATSDDGSQIWINGRTVANNDGEHGTTTRSGKVTLTRGAHPFEVLFFQSGGGFEFAVAWAGPGFQRTSIPGSVFRHEARPLLPLGTVDFPFDPAKVTAGREWFERLNCAACHEGTGIAPRKARPWLELASSSRKGCLADNVPAAAARYDLTPDQRQALRSMVAEAGRLATPASPAVAAATELSRLNCYACHSRDGVGGPGVSGHEPWFKLVGEADLGDEGRIPPLLTGVGGKLKSDWLNEVLLQGTKVRPYMATRMPLFGAANGGRLHAALRTADRSPTASAEPALTERDAKFGWKLAGRDGLSCIACHTFGTYGSMGIPALGLDTMHRRLEWDWFRRYLPDPAALRPGTRMPTFWPEGHAVNRDILGGDTGAQIQALWAYLAGGAKAEVPAGLIRGRMELVVDKEPLIYRNFIEGAGARAIGVGYPQHANLAFDAEHSRLALLWQGSFIDAARHSTDRGVGFEPPLGDHRIAFPAGPALAVLPSAEAAWPSTGTVRFRGYRFNAERQPLFDYSVGSVRVTDTFVPRPGEVDMSMVRTLQFSGTTSDRLWFRAAAGTIRRDADGSFVVDDKLKIRLRGGGEPMVVGQELRVPVTVPGELVEEFTW